jgi:hypothetical protein
MYEREWSEDLSRRSRKGTRDTMEILGNYKCRDKSEAVERRQKRVVEERGRQ